MNDKVEILAPAGSVESMKAAAAAGADAVYMGGARFGARAYADNPEEEELLRAVDYMHIHGKRIYLTVNTLLKDREMDELYDYLLPYYRQGLDGVIVQDVGVVEYVRTQFPDLPIHASTQMTITGAPGAAFMKEQGIVRVVPARELSLPEIKKIKSETGLEVECFVHGALCYCYSGQCLLSSLLGGRSGNRGQCAQPCRLPYSLEGGKPQTLMSLKDLCAIDMIPELIEAGIDSFKIEGRMKQPDYVYTVVSMYRKYTDLYYENGGEKYRDRYNVDEKDREILQGAYRRRGYCDGYYRRRNGKDMISFSRPQGGEEKSRRQEYELQEKINGKLILSPGNRARLELEHGRTKVSLEGAAAEPAVTQPLGKVRIEKQMRKTGGTPFSFQDFQVITEGDVFLPMQALNELRREGLGLLEKELLARCRRPESGGECVKGVPENSGKRLKDRGLKDGPLAVTVSVTEEAQLKEVVRIDGISAIYTDSSMFAGADGRMCKSGTGGICRSGADDMYENDDLKGLVCEGKNAGKEMYLAMPYIFRADTAEKLEAAYPFWEELFDGVLIRNWESYEWLVQKGYRKKIISDSNIYMYNRYARKFLNQTQIASYTAPVELNAAELGRLGISDCTFVAYGYQPVMVTAGCIKKTTGQCSRRDGLTYIRDRYQKKFAVKNYCEYCYNIIYNSSPLVLLNQREEIKALAPAALRLDFTTENGKQTKRIAALYVDAFVREKDIKTPDMDFTKGHFKRGVK